jgi:hypothetical protein
VNINICDEINAARDRGIIHCGMIEAELTDLSEIAPKFGLIFGSDIYQKISKAQAEVIAQRVLQSDMAYDHEIMTAAAAQALTSRFLDHFDQESSEYYTNGDYYSVSGRSWNSATTAIFDTGILIISKSRVGCLWVEDQD